MSNAFAAQRSAPHQAQAADAGARVFDLSDMADVLPHRPAATHAQRVDEAARVMQQALERVKRALPAQIVLPVVDAAVLSKVLDKYMLANPSHTNPMRVRTELVDEPQQWAAGNYLLTASFYQLSYAVQKSPSWTFQGRASLNTGGVQVRQEEGKRTRPDGEIQEGEFQCGPDGALWLKKGKRTFANGKIWEGEFQREPDGKNWLKKGKLTWPDVGIEEGEFQREPDGKNWLKKGSCKNADGEYFEGSFAHHAASGRTYLEDGLFTTPNGYRFEGSFVFDTDKKVEILTQGRKTYPDGTVDAGVDDVNGGAGCFQDVAANHDSNKYERAQLIGSNNQRTLPCGTQLRGYFEPKPGVLRSVLRNGEILHGERGLFGGLRGGLLNGKRDEGVFDYLPALDRIVLVDGKSYDRHHLHGAGGDWVRKGKREYISQLGGMVLMDGVAIDRDGTRRTGVRAYIPQLHQVCLVEGKIEYRDGRVEEGTWAWRPGVPHGDMHFTPKTVVPQRVLDRLQDQASTVRDLHRQVFSAQRLQRYPALAAVQQRLPMVADEALDATRDQVKQAQSLEELADALVAHSKLLLSLVRKLSLHTHADKGFNDDTSRQLFQRTNDLLQTLSDAQARVNASLWAAGVIWPNAWAGVN